MENENATPVVKMYFKGSSGVINPVDANGNVIKEGSILTTDAYQESNPYEFYERYMNHFTRDQITEIITRPVYIVEKHPTKKYLYGRGIHQDLYLHDFRFKYCKIVD